MKQKLLLTIIFALIIFPVVFVIASTTDGTIDSTYKNAWGENTGWINFGNSSGNVHITDSALTGYAWSDNYGWINLNPTTGGVLNNNEGTLSGYAWGQNIGWVNFSGVVINSSGEFTGTASGDNAGTLNFNCSNCRVVTDWRPASSRGPVLSGGYAPMKSAFSGGFKIIINNGDIYTKNSTVEVEISGGEGAVSMDVANFPDFSGFSVKPYAPKFSWALTQGDGEKNVYVKLHDVEGKVSETLTDSIILGTQAPSIKINPKSVYQTTEDIVLSGKTDKNSSIIFFWDNKYGSAKSDEKGDWLVNLGKMPEGLFNLQVTVENEYGNSRSASVNILVQKEQIVQPNIEKEKQPTIIENIKNKIDDLLNKQPEQPPEKITTIPKDIPEVLQGKWNLLPIGAQNIKQK